MKKEPYYLKYYKEWMNAGRIPKCGLCNSLDDDMRLGMFAPPFSGYWGYDGGRFFADGDLFQRRAEQKRGITRDQARHEFTPFRQTIVLFLAAMNGELTKENLKSLGL